MLLFILHPCERSLCYVVTVLCSAGCAHKRSRDTLHGLGKESNIFSFLSLAPLHLTEKIFRLLLKISV